MSDAIQFENQQSWETFGVTIQEEFKLSVMAGSSSASQIPKASMGEDQKYTLAYRSLHTGPASDTVVLDIMITEIDRADGEAHIHDADSLAEAVRAVVVRYRDFATSKDCHLTGNYLSGGTKVKGALLRIYRNKDFTCKGHPEMLLGAPIGMYHCDYCGQMQAAGTFHS